MAESGSHQMALGGCNNVEYMAAWVRVLVDNALDFFYAILSHDESLILMEILTTLSRNGSLILMEISSHFSCNESLDLQLLDALI